MQKRSSNMDFTMQEVPLAVEKLERRILKAGDHWYAHSGTNNLKVKIRGIGYSGKRIMWAHRHGELPPPNRFVVSECGQPHCINPDHLTLSASSKAFRAPGPRKKSPVAPKGEVIECLRCGDDFATRDRVYNRICQECKRDPPELCSIFTPFYGGSVGRRR